MSAAATCPWCGAIHADPSVERCPTCDAVLVEQPGAAAVFPDLSAGPGALAAAPSTSPQAPPTSQPPADVWAVPAPPSMSRAPADVLAPPPPPPLPADIQAPPSPPAPALPAMPAAPPATPSEPLGPGEELLIPGVTVTERGWTAESLRVTDPLLAQALTTSPFRPDEADEGVEFPSEDVRRLMRQMEVERLAAEREAERDIEPPGASAAPHEGGVDLDQAGGAPAEPAEPDDPSRVPAEGAPSE